MTTHELKTWPVFYDAVADGSKPFEIRRDDRSPRFAVGDILHLRRYDPGEEAYTGESTRRVVTFVSRDAPWWVPEGFVCMGLELGNPSLLFDAARLEERRRCVQDLLDKARECRVDGDHLMAESYEAGALAIRKDNGPGTESTEEHPR